VVSSRAAIACAFLTKVTSPSRTWRAGDAYTFKNRQEHGRPRKNIDCEQRSLDLNFVVVAGSDHFCKGAGPGTRATSVRRTDAQSSSRTARSIMTGASSAARPHSTPSPIVSVWRAMHWQNPRSYFRDGIAVRFEVSPRGGAVSHSDVPVSGRCRNLGTYRTPRRLQRRCKNVTASK
jgi:hypothetical protein